MHHIGVDGCRAGWVAVYRDGAGLQRCVAPTINDLWSTFPTAERILIDIPIGLPWGDVPMRPCDRMARQLLGKPRSSSVFAVPCREALSEEDPQAASRVNESTIGKRLSPWSLSIKHKIAEVDAFLLANVNQR